jgi:hypothetical protein
MTLWATPAQSESPVTGCCGPCVTSGPLLGATGSGPVDDETGPSVLLAEEAAQQPVGLPFCPASPSQSLSRDRSASARAAMRCRRSLSSPSTWSTCAVIWCAWFR